MLIKVILKNKLRQLCQSLKSEIKIIIKQQPIAYADTGSDSTLLRQNDAITATLDIQPPTNPLQVRFLDGERNSHVLWHRRCRLTVHRYSAPTHVYADETLRQSLFGIAEITN